MFCCSRIARQRLVSGLRQWTHSRHCGREQRDHVISARHRRRHPRRPPRRLPRPRGRAPSARTPRGRPPRPCTCRCGTPRTPPTARGPPPGGDRRDRPPARPAAGRTARAPRRASSQGLSFWMSHSAVIAWVQIQAYSSLAHPYPDKVSGVRRNDADRELDWVIPSPERRFHARRVDPRDRRPGGPALRGGRPARARRRRGLDQGARRVGQPDRLEVPAWAQAQAAAGGARQRRVGDGRALARRGLRRGRRGVRLRGERRLRGVRDRPRRRDREEAGRRQPRAGGRDTGGRADRLAGAVRPRRARARADSADRGRRRRRRPPRRAVRASTPARG